MFAALPGDLDPPVRRRIQQIAQIGLQTRLAHPLVVTGPILVKVAAGVGFSFGGVSGPLAAWVLAGAATLITISASCAVALPVLATYDSLRDHPLMVNIGRYIMPVICGLLIQVCASMLEVSASVAESAGIAATPLTWVTLAVVAVLAYVHLKELVPDTVLLLGCGAASLLVLGV